MGPEAQTAFQEALDIGYGQAVIGEGPVLVPGQPLAVLHLPFAEHAGPAVDHQAVRREVLGKIGPGMEDEIKVQAAVFPYPARQLDRAHVAALAVVEAAFGDQNPVSLGQAVQGRNSPDGLVQEPVVAGEEDGKGGQGHLTRGLRRHLVENLAVSDDQPGWTDQAGQGGTQFRLPDHHRHPVGFQDIPDGLLLSQNQPALGNGVVQGHDQHHEIGGLYEVSDDFCFRPLVGGRRFTGAHNNFSLKRP